LKTLLLVRHAQSQSASSYANDFQRQLSATGMAEAKQVGNVILKENTIPRLMVSSPALRAIKTAEIIAGVIDYPAQDIRNDDFLYEVDLTGFSEHIQSLDDSFDTVLYVGHNPCISELSFYLTRYSVGNLSPGSIFCCEFNVDQWKAITNYGGNFKYYHEPNIVI
jgi:phosphohistidine phosphatase